MNDEDDVISAEELLAVSAEIASLYPPPRAGTEVVLLDLSPHRAHAYWNIEPQEYRAAEETAAGSALVIRLHDVTGIEFSGTNPHDTFDTVVAGSQGQVDLNVWKDGRTYLAELGFRRADGHLDRLAVSDRMDMPRAPVAAMPVAQPPEMVENAAIVEEARIEMAGIAADAVATEARVAAEVKPLRAEVSAGPWPDAAELSALLPPRDEVVETWYEKTAAADSPITSAQQEMEARVRDITVEFDSDSAAKSLDLSAARINSAGAELETAVNAPQLRDAAETMTDPQAAGAEVRIEDYLTYSSHSFGQREANVEVVVEVVIRGRVPPGRRATLYGRQLPVNSDGSFAMKQELPHPGPLLPYLVPPPNPGGG